jgi:hypothetical protein
LSFLPLVNSRPSNPNLFPSISISSINQRKK